MSREELPDELPDDDHWFFFNFLEAPASDNLMPVLPDVAMVDTSATIRVALRGVNYSVDHHAELSINGIPLGDGYWSGN